MDMSGNVRDWVNDWYITDANELRLGTSPWLFDTDCGQISDTTKLYNLANPLNSDGDGLIDARERRRG